MRKILSFLSMAATLLAIVFFGVPSIADNPNLGFEFSGGYEIVYEITDENGNSSTQTSKDAAEVIASRIIIWELMILIFALKERMMNLFV